MFCIRCGYQNPDEANFCFHCGQTMNIHTPQQTPQEHGTFVPPVQNQIPNPYPAPPTQQVNYSYSEAPHYASPPPVARRSSTRIFVDRPTTSKEYIKDHSPAQKAIKKTASSPAFLIATIAYTLAIFLTSWLQITDIQMFNAFFGYISISELHQFETVFYVVSLIASSVPTAIVIIGLWKIFASGVSKSNAPLNPSGLVMIRVIATIDKIVGIITIIVVEFALLPLLRTLSGDSDFIFYIALGFMSAFLILFVVYLFKIVTTIEVVITSVSSGIPFSSDVSGFVAVMNFIMSAIIIIFGLSIYNYSPIFLLSIFLLAISLICFGITIFMYKGKMNRIIYAESSEGSLNTQLW